IPVNNLYNYSYTQQIYLSTEIGQSGFINTIRFYWQGNGTMTENNDWTVYLGYKTANTFASNTDWVPIAELTEVFSGIVPTPSAAGFTVEIPLAAPFLYDMSLGNLVVAVDENSAGYEYNSNMFRYTSGTDRSLYYRADGTNPDPASPPTASAAPYDFYNNIQIEMTPLTACSGTPNGGVATSSSNP